MRHRYADKRPIVRIRSFVAAMLFAIVMWVLPSVTSADTVYRWQDPNGRVHFSNRAGQAPSGSQAVRLPSIGVVRRPDTGRLATSPQTSPESTAREVAPRRVVGCEAPNPTELINAVVTSIPATATRGPGGQDPQLALFVAAQPVSHGGDAVLEIVPGQDWNDSRAAVDQGALAYPASGACPQTPPLVRYAVVSERSRTPSSSRCDDFRSAFTEIEVALRHNESVAGTFQYASNRFSDAATNGGVFQAVGMDITLPTWLAKANAAQTAELAVETEELLDELSVAREEIAHAAETLGCW